MPKKEQPKTEFRIDLLGTKVEFLVDEEPAYLKSLLERYEQKVEHVKKVYEKSKKEGAPDPTPLQVALLTGFLLIDECERLRCGHTGIAPNEAQEAEKITLELIGKIDKVFDEIER